MSLCNAKHYNNDVIEGPARKVRCRPDALEHPHDTLRENARRWKVDVTDKEFASKMDEKDELAHLRDLFCYPKNGTLPNVDLELANANEDCIYFSGNSLGLMPKSTPERLKREMEKWAAMGVCGHFVGEMPWAECDEKVREGTAKLVGAKVDEVVLMNALTVNQHLALISFYKPTPKRHKILLESKAFPSDHYCIESQITLRGYNPNESMICMAPREGEQSLRTEDIIALIESEGDEIALVLFPGVQYYTGQLFDMEKIVQTGHRIGCMVGFDLAHAIGNVELELNNWGVDFAVWCNYKYMNSGAGTVGGLFIHEKHNAAKHDRLTGWWSHKRETRFLMSNKMELSDGPAGYRISNPSMFHSAALESSLEVFSQTSMAELCAKSRLLTGYLEMLLTHYFPRSAVEGSTRPHVTILTPTDPRERGCQLSVEFSLPIFTVFNQLVKYGIVCDKRKPGVLRVAPVPLYNSFMDVHRFTDILRTCLDKVLATKTA